MTTALSLLTEATRVAPNGGEVHEVRWIPTSRDEDFSTAATTISGGGTMTLVLQGVDGTCISGTNADANGFAEITTVWEWTPAFNSNVTVNPQTPLPYTTQQVLSHIGDMGAFLYQGILRAGEGAVRGATAGVMMGLTAGVRQYATRPRGLPNAYLT